MVVMFSFDSFEAMHQRLVEMTDEANAGLASAQRLITYGDHWVRFWDMRSRLVVFSKVLTLDEIRHDEAALGAPPNEVEYMVRETQRRHADGFLYGLARSRWYPAGEWGDTHRANVWPVEQSVYEEAVEVGFDIDALGVHGKFAMVEAWAGFSGHVKAARHGAQ